MNDATSTEAWQQALAEAERLQALDAARRADGVRWLQEQQPALHARVQSLLSASTGQTASVLGPLASDAALHETVDLAGRQVGAYRFVGLLGAGGMGQVWLAERSDGRFQGRVAIKLLGTALHAQRLERFRREGQLLGRLSHPYIARLLDAGALPGGQPYLVLEHVAGERVDRWCDGRRLGVVARIELFMQLCAAVSHAHANLVVHRDLKPSNILVGDDGVPKLLDFGIAKLIESETGGAEETALTQVAGRALTPEYAAPEQVSGAPITTATDVYALGVLLYLLLTGRRPYGNAPTSPVELARQVLEVDALPLWQGDLSGAAPARATTPERLRRELRGDLDRVVAKALKKDPAERYAGVQALADELQRYLSHQPVLARPDSLAYRARKFVRRHRLPVLAAALAALALGAGLGAALWQAELARQQRALAIAERDRTREVTDFLVDLFQTNSVHRDGPVAAKQLSAKDLLDRGAAKLREERSRGNAAPPLSSTPSGGGGAASGHTQATALQSQLLYTLGQLYGEIGEHARAASLLEDAVWQVQRLHGPRHAEVAKRLVSLGGLQLGAGQFSRAQAALAQAQEVFDAIGDANSIERGLHHTHLAQLHLAGDAALAMRHAQQAVALLDGAPHARQARIAFALLGHAHIRLGDFVAAEAAHRRSLELALHDSGAERVPAAVARADLGEVLLMRGKLSEAEAELRQSVLGLRKASPDDAVMIAQAELRHGRVLHAMGERQRARSLMAGAAAVLEAQLGADAVNTLLARQMLAGSLIAEGDVAAAAAQLDLIQPAYERQPQLRSNMASVLNHRARLQLAAGDLAAARAGVERALALMRAADSTRGLAALESEHILAEIELRAGRHDEALQHHRAASAEAEPRGIVFPVSKQRLLLHEGRVAMARGDVALALERFESVKRNVLAAPDGELRGDLLASATLALGRAHLVQHDLARARPELEQALALMQRWQSPASLQLAAAQTSLARCLLALGEAAAARELAAQAQSIHERHARVSEHHREPLRVLSKQLAAWTGR